MATDKKVILCLVVMVSLSVYAATANNVQETTVEKCFEFRDVYPPQTLGSNANDERVPLFFGLMMSFGGDVKSSGAIPGVQVALDAINNQPDLLPGYTLHYTLTDSQVCAIS